eukprot:gene13354-biopygen22482
MAPIGLSPNQVLLTATTVDRWNFGMKNGLRLHGLSAALRTIKPAPGAEWTIGCGLSGPSQHQGGNSGDSHQAGVSSADSGQRSGEPPAVPQGSSARTQRQPTTSGTSGGGEETGGKASTSKDAAPSAPQRGESSDVGGVSEQERARAWEDERNVRDFLRTLEESRLHEIVLDKALAYVLLTVDQSLQFHFENHPSAQSIYDEAMGWLAADDKQHIHLLAIEFRALYMADTETVTQWFDRLRRLAAKLIEGGQPVTEQDGVELAILGARHARFQALQQTNRYGGQWIDVLCKCLADVTSLMPMLVAGVQDFTIPVAAEAEVRVVDELELSFAPTARVPLTSSTPVGPSIRICVPLAPPRPTQGEVEVEAVELLLEAEPLCLGWSLTPCPDRVIVHIDSGAGRCITGSQALFSTFQFVSNGPSVKFGDGVVQQATGIGTIVLSSRWLDAPITLTQCLYVPDCPVNLLSVSATARDLACVISFTSATCHATIGPRTLWQIPVSPLGVYQFDAVVGEIPSLLCVDLDVSIPPMSPIELWHKRFGHPGFPAMSQLILGTLVTGMPIISKQQLRKFKESPCDACARGKAKRVPYHAPRRKTHSPLEIVHVDLMGPFSQGLRGEYYLLVMVDDYSNWHAVVAMVTKGNSAFWIVNTLKAWMALLVGVVLGCLRSDQAKEFCTAEVEDFLKSVKARHELSSVYQVPDVSLLRIFGATGYVKLLDKDSRKGKLNGRALRRKMIGYAPVSKAWQLWLPDSHRIIESRDVDWYEGAGPAPVPGQDPFDGDFSLDGPDTAVNGLGPEVVTSPTPSDSPVGTAAGSDSGFRISDSESGPGFHMHLRSRNQAPAVFPTVSTLRTLLAGMVHNKMFARQLDIKTAFLNGVLEEELNMEQPRGFVVRGGWVCKLIKSLYGLKQSPRKWCEERDIPSLIEDETKQSPHVPMISGAVTKHAAGSPALPNNLMYASLIGSLIYLSTCTRPDIAYFVSPLSRFTSEPTEAHWRAAQRVLVYLRKYPNLGIRYSHSSDFAVHAYSDASFGDDPEGRRSQTGMAILASGGVVHWASKWQITPAVSTGEAEYQALAATARDVQWFKHLRVDLGLPCSLVTIQCDSTVANSWCAEVALVPRAKHIDIMHHYVRDLGMSGADWDCEG